MDVVINTAISGHTTRDLLAGFEWRIAQFAPHVVLIMIGMNDSDERFNVPLEEFRHNLRELVKRCSDLGAVVVLQTTCPVIPGNAPQKEPHFASYMEAVREVARESGMPLVDHTNYWLSQSEFPINWMSDAFHPNAYGHIAFAQYLIESFGVDKKNAFLFRMPAAL